MKKKLLGILFALLLIFAPKTVSAAEEMRVERVYGASRIDTAIAISNACFKDTDYVVIASGSNFPDALAGGVLAETVKAPVLLTYKDALSPATEKEIARLTPSTIYVLGGKNAISEAVENKLATYGTVKRLEGYSRFDTAKAIADEIRAGDPNTSKAYGIVNGYNFADALGASALLAKRNMPLLLDQPTLEATRETVLFGGTMAVPHKPYGKRIAGINRTDTSIAIAKEGFPDAKTVILTNGWNYPDALSAISLSVKFDAPILLTGTNRIDQKLTNYLKSSEINHVVIVGGPLAVSKDVENLVKNIYSTTPAPAPATKLYDVVRVVDGDTIIVNIDGKEERIRLIGIDTPESVHPDSSLNSELGRIASNYTKNLLTGKKVSLELDVQERDRYGRILAYVYLDGVMVNKTLLSAGMAQVSTYPPNVKYVDDFTALQKTARDNNVGLWGDIKNETPPTPQPQPQPDSPSGYGYYGNAPYVGNSNTKAFHHLGCHHINKMRTAHVVEFNSAQEARNNGYDPCGSCKP